MTPHITVTMPVFNGERFLARTLDSLLAQTFPNFTVLCADDCSTDGSRSLIESYRTRDRRIVLTKTPSNLGSSPKVMNYCLDQVATPFQVYSSQDDFFSEDWLERMYQRAMDTAAGAVIPDLVYYHGSPEHSVRCIGLHGDRSVVLSNRDAVRLSLDATISSFALFASEIVRRVRYEEFGMNADEYSYRVFYYHTNKVVFSPGTFYYNQINPDAVTKRLSVGSFDSPYTCFRMYTFLRDHAFSSQVCGKELMRAVSSLVWNQQRLATASAFTEAERATCEERLMRAYRGLTESSTLQEIKRQPGLENKLKAFLISHGPAFFRGACASTAGLRLAHSRIRQQYAARSTRAKS